MSRDAPLHLDAEAFRAAGHALVNDLAAMFAALESPSELPVTAGLEAEAVHSALTDAPLPVDGRPADELLREATDLLLTHATQIAHPRFWGYICGSPAPIGALADLLASGVNPNVAAGRWRRWRPRSKRRRSAGSPSCSAIRRTRGGLLVSGGNMANFVGFLAARRAKAGWDVRADGPGGERPRAARLRSAETHTWMQKAADLFGLGTARSAGCDRRRAALRGRRPARRRSRPTARRATCRSSSSARPARSARARSTRCASIAPSAARRGSGSTSTARTAASPPSLPEAPEELQRARRWPIRSRSTRTSGSTRRSRRAARSCAIRRRCSTPSATTRPTTT